MGVCCIIELFFFHVCATGLSADIISLFDFRLQTCSRYAGWLPGPDLVKSDLESQGCRDKEGISCGSLRGIDGGQEKEVNVLTKMIEQQLVRIGDLGEAFQQMKHGLERHR